MSSPVEIAFLQHLTDLDSMEVIIADGLDPEILATSDFRAIYEYAINFYFDSDKTRAVNIQALETYHVSAGRSFKDVLDDHEVAIEEDPELPIRDVIEKLKGQYAYAEAGGWSRRFVTEVADAASPDRSKVISQGATELMRIAYRLTPRRFQVEGAYGVSKALTDYEARLKTEANRQGLSLGLKELDDHTFYVHPGEVAIIGAAPKVGKSNWSLRCLLDDWRRGRTVGLFSLENPIDMTFDRVICHAVSVDSQKFQAGECNEGELQRFYAFKEQVDAAPNKFHVLSPPKGQRTVEFMIRQAMILDCDSIIMDQLSHIEHSSPRNKQRNEIVRDIMQDLHLGASTGPVDVPIVCFAQISRKGKADADKRGYHLLDDFAESSEVEKSASIACTIYQNIEDRIVHEALFQIVAARRVDLKSWDINWVPSMGYAKSRGERMIGE
jgi:replicative DNA helicase